MYTVNYNYNEDGQISQIENENQTTRYTYNKMGQLTSRTSPYDSYTNIQAETYEYNTYEKNGDTYTTNQLLAINDQTYKDNDRTSTYDANGNIVSVSYNGDTYAYSYDDYGYSNANAWFIGNINPFRWRGNLIN